MEELEKEVIRIKASIQEYKKETSNEKIEELIIKKRQEKEN